MESIVRNVDQQLAKKVHTALNVIYASTIKSFIFNIWTCVLGNTTKSTEKILLNFFYHYFVNYIIKEFKCILLMKKIIPHLNRFYYFLVSTKIINSIIHIIMCIIAISKTASISNVENKIYRVISSEFYLKIHRYRLITYF